MTFSFTLNRDKVVAVVLIVTFTLYLSQLRHLPTPVVNGADAGPALYGYGLVAIAYLFLLNIAIRSNNETTVELDSEMTAQAVLFITASLLYVFLLFRVGFFIASALYAIAVIRIFDTYDFNRRSAIVVAVVTVVSVFLIFELIFSVRLPMGVFG